MSADTSAADLVRETGQLAAGLGTSRHTAFPVGAMRGGNSVARHPIGLPRVGRRPVYRSSGVARGGSRQARKHCNDSLPTFEQVIASATGEIVHLTRLLRELCCRAQLRRTDGIILPLNSERDDCWTHTDAVDHASQPSGSHIEQWNYAPIYDPHGRLFATLHLHTGELDRSPSLDRLLGALIESVASAITERWFRLHHRRHWIVAAQRQDGKERPIALAVDRNQRVVGADSAARRFLGLEGGNIGSNLSLSAMFSIDADPFTDAPGCDVALRVLRCGDGAPYSIVITCPDSAALALCHDERLLIHTRPRSEVIRHWKWADPKEGKSSGLPPRRLRQVQEYIDAHIDSVLGLSELAACAGLSVSHFSRSFLKSVGMTPHSYVLRRRVLRAQQLLEDSELSMVEIAMSTGFCDQSHLSRLFRERVGLPPGAFRAKHR
jgi:AraC-like DNA-binding protein